MICCDVRVLVNLRRVLAALALAGCGLAIAAPDAQAGTAADTKRASDVFTGVVGEASKTPKRGNRPATFTYDVQVERVYKGDVGTETVQVTSSTTSKTCRSLVLDPGRGYVFFVRAAGPTFAGDTCGGTDRATSGLVAKVEGLLGDGRLPTPVQPEQATFTRVVDAEPATLTRMMAPGVALVLAGLLGLFVVRRVGSRA